MIQKKTPKNKMHLVKRIYEKEIHGMIN